MKNRSDRLLSIDCERLDMPLLESGGWHDIESAIPSIPRITPAFHVTYLARQEATWRVEPDHRLWIQAGQLGLIQPHSRHQGAWAADHPNQHFWFYFRPNACGAQRHTPFTRKWL
ncbi:MAG: hypothetical protein M3Q07_12520, partial [Pseudobdellovibrionaceae bacterium]|nr:hypothetical protein [Pseudobdellovibrionaceae bacterium]